MISNNCEDKIINLDILSQLENKIQQTLNNSNNNTSTSQIEKIEKIEKNIFKKVINNLHL